MVRSLTTQDISWFLDQYEKGQLDLDPPYQRRSVWSAIDKRYFIDTIMNGYPAPPVFLHKTLNDTGRTTYHVVDGKQRLQTIIEFTENKIRLPDDFSDITLQKKRWKDLGREAKEQFWNYVLVVEMLPDVTDASIRTIFDRINRNSRKLMPQEMRHAKYDGWFITTVENEAEQQEWKDFGIATAARTKRMADVQFVSELFKVLLNGKIEGFDQDALDDLYAAYEDISEQSSFVEEDFLTEVERIKAYIREAMAAQPKIQGYLRVQSHFYSLWAYLALEKERLLPVEELAPKYAEFMAKVSAAISDPEMAFSTQDKDRQAVRDYANNARGASTDLTPRLNRHKALLTVLHGGKAADHEDR